MGGSESQHLNSKRSVFTKARRPGLPPVGGTGNQMFRTIRSKNAQPTRSLSRNRTRNARGPPRCGSGKAIRPLPGAAGGQRGERGVCESHVPGQLFGSPGRNAGVRRCEGYPSTARKEGIRARCRSQGSGQRRPFGGGSRSPGWLGRSAFRSRTAEEHHQSSRARVRVVGARVRVGGA